MKHPGVILNLSKSVVLIRKYGFVEFVKPHDRLIISAIQTNTDKAFQNLNIRTEQ